MARYTLDLGEDLDKVISELATKKSKTKSEIIRNAVASYIYLTKQTSANDTEVSITKDGEILKDVVLP